MVEVGVTLLLASPSNGYVQVGRQFSQHRRIEQPLRDGLALFAQFMLFCDDGLAIE